MRWRMSDFFTWDKGGNGGAFPLVLFAPVESLPNQYTFRCPRTPVFLSLLRLFAAIRRKLLAINNLQLKSCFSN
jgi:hypothetical protein